MLHFRDVEKLYDEHREELESIEDSAERNRRLVELHVWSQAESLLQKPAVAEALRVKGLKVHAFVYDSVKEECVQLVSVEQP
jgi:carbonic anhydrase